MGSSSSISDSTYGATQTVVSFLTQTGVSTYAPDQRIFDFEISQNAQSVYSILMETILGLQEKIQKGSTTKQEDLQALADAIGALNTWSRMKTISNGQETAQSSLDLAIPTSLYDLMSTQLQDLTYTVTDSSGNSVKRPTVWVDSSTGATYIHVDTTMNRYMAESLDTLLRTMRAAGWDPVYLYSLAGLDANAVTRLATVVSDTNAGGKAIFGLASLINKGISAATQANVIESAASQSQSIQQLLMVDYVVRGNEMLFNEMNSLNDAITLNQSILSYLNSLQNLMNQKDPQQFLLQLQYLSNSQNAYSQFEQQTFGSQTLSNIPKFSEDEISTYITNLTIKNQGLDPTDPLVRAQYGLEDSYTNLGAVLSYNLSKGYYSLDTNGNITLDPRGIDLSVESTATKYGVSYTDYERYINNILPALKNYIAGGGDPATFPNSLSLRDKILDGIEDTIPGIFNSFNLSSPLFRLQLNPDAASNPTAPLFYILGGGGAGPIVAYLPDDPNFEVGATNIGLPPELLRIIATPNNPIGITYADLSGTDMTSAETKLVQYLSKFFNPATLDTTTDGTTPIVVDGYTFDELTRQSSTSSYSLKDTLLATFKKIVQDKSKTMDISQIDLTDAQTLKSYGLLQGSGSFANPDIAENTAMDAFIDKATGSFDTSIEQIIQNLDTLINKIKVATGSTSSALAQQLTTIKNDFITAGSISDWVKDFSSQSEGTFQTDLNNAITASQALNDTERENLRQVMFVYEEFYKSATGMLESLSQLITKIANNIRG